MTALYLDQCAGALVSLACSDAVGSTVQCRSGGRFHPLTGSVAGAHCGIQPIAHAWRARLHRGPALELTARRLGNANNGA